LILEKRSIIGKSDVEERSYLFPDTLKYPGFMQKSKLLQIIPYLLLFIIPVLIGTYFRLYPLLNYTPDSLHEKATLLVIAKLREKIEQDVQAISAELPQAQKDKLIIDKLNELLHQEGPQIRKIIKDVAKNIEEDSLKQQDYPYLLASDSFYYFNLTENIIKTGTISDTFKGSKYLNKLMLAPYGHWEPLTLHPYTGYFLYHFLKIFNPSIPLMYAVSFTPLVLAALAVIPFLLICWSLGCRPLASLVGTVYFFLAPIFIKRSSFGWYDNDPHHILFPLFLLAILSYGFRHRAHLKISCITGFAGATVILLYALFWQGWILMFCILGLSAVLICLHNHFLLQQKTFSRHLMIQFAITLMVSFLGIGVMFGVNEFFILFKEGWHALINFLEPQLSSWPDLYLSVGELHHMSFDFLKEMLGGHIFFGLACLGLVVSLIRSCRPNNLSDPLSIIMLGVLAIVSFLMAKGAQRFAILCVVPFSLLFTLGLHHVMSFIHFLEKKFSLKFFSYSLPLKIMASGLILFLCLMLIIPPVRYLHSSLPNLLNPIFNETWDKVLTEIRQKTPNDSIINTWWPPGHFIKAMAHRRVTFDGATINFPQAYWMANVFLSQNEIEALGILCMLNLSANRAVESLKDSGLPLSGIIETLKKIISLDSFRAQIILHTILKDPLRIQEVLRMTHGTPPPSYILFYNELAEKNIQFPFIGNWNFKAIETINANPALLAKIPNRNSDEYIQFLWQLAGGMPKFSEELDQISRIDRIAIFEENLSMNLDTMDCQIASSHYGEGIPFSIFYLLDNKFVEKIQEKANLPYSVVLFGEEGSRGAVLTDRNLAQSLFVRLHYFNGAGLKYIKPFTRQSDLTKQTHISVFEIDWEGFNKNRVGME